VYLCKIELKIDKKMKYNNILLIFLFCVLKMQSATAQTDSMYIKDSIFFHNKEPLIIYDTFSGGSSSIIYYHYDNGLKKDSAVYERGGFTQYYHYVDEKEEVKYTYYHKSGISVLSRTETNYDTIAVLGFVKVVNGDTIEQSDTIFLYYPDLETFYYYDNNITLEAFKENQFSQMGTSENRMRIFKIMYDENNSVLAAVTYTISDVTQDTLQITKKTGKLLSPSLQIPKKDMIKDYTYESTSKRLPDKKIRKILQEMTTLDYFPIDKILDNLIIEYQINGKYYLLTFSDLSIYKDFSPEMRKTFKLSKKLIAYLENSFPQK